MMKKGQITIGVILLMAIAVIIGLVLFQQSAANVDGATRTNSGATEVRNLSITWGAVNNIQTVQGQEIVRAATVYNKTNTGVAVAAANYSVYECVRPTDGLKGICVKTIGDPAKDVNMGVAANLSYSYYPDGYIDDAGARSIADIIILLVAIAIALVVLAKIKFDW